MTHKFNLLYLSIVAFGLLVLSSCKHREDPTTDPSPVLQPVIQSFRPTTGAAGTLVRIRGRNLDNVQKVRLASTEALILNSSDSLLLVYAMPAATLPKLGAVEVVTKKGSGNSSTQFSYTESPVANVGPTKLVPSMDGKPAAGASCALSADGQRLLVGGPYDNGNRGAAWLYEWNSTLGWVLLRKFSSNNVPTGKAEQGTAVALSADGNTVVVGGQADRDSIGAVWVWQRGAQGEWLETKLPFSTTTTPKLGWSVAVSADGNTIIAGGPKNLNRLGGAWVWQRSASGWLAPIELLPFQLFGSTPTELGIQVAISADGRTVLVGGRGDADERGASWVYVLNGGNWSPQGKLFGTDNQGISRQGRGLALSADGNTAAVGGGRDNDGKGAFWIYRRSGTTWGPVGGKYVASDGSSGANQGFSLGLTADGKHAIVTGYFNEVNIGAAWHWREVGGIWRNDYQKLLPTDFAQLSDGVNMGRGTAISADGRVVVAGGWHNNNKEGAVWIWKAR